MARDYRHGHGQKQGFTRKSQQGGRPIEKGSVSLIWGAGFFVSAVVLVAFFVTQHFMVKGAKSTAPAENNIYQAAVELQEQTSKSIEAVSQQLQPKSVKIVEEVTVSPAKEPIAHDGVLEQQYTFYQGLSQTEVVVDAEPIPVKLENPYYIQAGTFGSEAVAKQEQARLERLGQILQISVLHQKNRTYYRLRVGPFDDRLILNKRRNELRELGLDTLLIKAAVTQDAP